MRPPGFPVPFSKPDAADHALDPRKMRSHARLYPPRLQSAIVLLAVGLVAFRCSASWATRSSSCCQGMGADAERLRECYRLCSCTCRSLAAVTGDFGIVAASRAWSKSSRNVRLRRWN
jgi:hypothetical protein